MRVIARQVDWSKCPARLAQYAKRSQTFLTIGREYVVHAVVVFDGIVFLQVVVDDIPLWQASWLFEPVDTTLPEDWIGNFQHEDPIFLLGPHFVAKDVDSYTAIVDMDGDQMTLFWKRLEERGEWRRTVNRRQRFMRFVSKLLSCHP